jgi:hypothetical protein
MEIVRDGGVGFEAVWLGRSRASCRLLVGNVGDGLGHGAAGRGRLDPPHGCRQGDGDELLFPVVLGEDDGESGTVGGLQGQAVERVLDVELAQVHRAIARVSMSHFS